MLREPLRIGPLALPGEWVRPPAARGQVVFVHGSGSSRLSPRNQQVAAVLNVHGLATLLFDLLTDAEADERSNVFDIALLAERVDQALAALERVRAPTLLIVGGGDREVLALNRQALSRLHGDKQLAVVPGATHLFEEPGALARVAQLASDWFVQHPPPPAGPR